MRKIVKYVFAVAFAAVAGYGVYANQRVDAISDVMAANVEALAEGEEYPASPNPGSKCTGGPRMCYMGQGNVFGKR